MAIALADAGATPKPKASEVKVRPNAIERISAGRGTSPWQGYTGSYEEEQRGKRVIAVKIAPEHERPAHLDRYTVDGEPLLAIDRKNRRVIVNEKHLSDIERPDATRLGSDERFVVGTVKTKALLSRPRDLTRFLVESELIQTYAHLESELSLVEEDDGSKLYRATLTGRHVYYTNEANEGPLSFVVEIDKKTGTVTILGR